MAMMSKLEQEVRRWRNLKSQAHQANLKSQEEKIDRIISLLEKLVRLRRGEENDVYE